ncbi:hypothetical protein GCM10020255_011390 [Rhodococcus baikonurensis]
MLNLRLPPHAGKPAAASAGRSGPHRDRRDGHRVLPGLTIPCVNDIIAYKFNISLNAMMWIGRIGMVLLPPIAFFVTYRFCLGLRRSDREVLEHGIETGIPRGGDSRAAGTRTLICCGSASYRLPS